MGGRRQVDEKRIAGPHHAVCENNGHDASFADERTVFISREHGGHQPWLEVV